MVLPVDPIYDHEMALDSLLGGAWEVSGICPRVNCTALVAIGWTGLKLLIKKEPSVESNDLNSCI